MTARQFEAWLETEESKEFGYKDGGRANRLGTTPGAGSSKSRARRRPAR